MEAGLRSFDMTMPEEVNRILTDRLSALCLTPSADGDENLAREGIAAAVCGFSGQPRLPWGYARCCTVGSSRRHGID